MPKFAANLTLLFNEHPFTDRFSAARKAGFDAVEMLFPYVEPAPRVRALLQENRLDLALINTPVDHWADGARGNAALAGGADDFRADLERALDYAQLLGPAHIHLMAGIAEGPAAHDAFLRSLEWATSQAPGQSFLIEPLNPRDMPGYFLNSFDLAAGIIAEIGAPNLWLQFDVYHAHMITADVAGAWADHGALARHIQIGRIPDRADPVGGEFDFPAFFDALDAAGYDGWVSGEYHPAGATGDGLAWMAKA